MRKSTWNTCSGYLHIEDKKPTSDQCNGAASDGKESYDVREYRNPVHAVIVQSVHYILSDTPVHQETTQAFAQVDAPLICRDLSSLALTQCGTCTPEIYRCASEFASTTTRAQGSRLRVPTCTHSLHENPTISSQLKTLKAVHLARKGPSTCCHHTTVVENS